jgi:hypothetical protein
MKGWLGRVAKSSTPGGDLTVGGFRLKKSDALGLDCTNIPMMSA